MTRPRSILLVSHYFSPHLGGVEAVAEAEARVLAQRGHRVSVVTSDCGDGEAPAGLPFALRRVKAWNGLEQRMGVPFPLFAPTLITTMWRHVRRADVVHIHDQLYLSSWVAALHCRLTGTPYVVTQHVGLVHHPNPAVRLVQRLVHRSIGALVLGWARAVLPINAFIESTVREHLPTGTEVEIVPNGVDPSTYRPPTDGEKAAERARLGLPADERLVLFVGRFVPKKGFPLVASSVSDNYRLVFVGGDRPADLPKDDRRIFLGARSPQDVARIYRAVDAYVGASVGECPLVVLEAMSSGLPVLLNEDPGYHAIGADGPGVRYVDMAGEDLRGTIERMVAERETIDAMGTEARRTAAGSFSWDSHADQLIAIYERLAA